MTNKIYRIDGAAKKLGVSQRSIFRYIHEGKLKATKIGHWRIAEEDLRRFVADRTNTNDLKRRP